MIANFADNYLAGQRIRDCKAAKSAESDPSEEGIDRIEKLAKGFSVLSSKIHIVKQQFWLSVVH